MDMSWIASVEDPQPKRRIIYDADSYDTRFGDPYWREGNEEPESAWSFYTENDMGGTFEEYAWNTSVEELRDELATLNAYLSGAGETAGFPREKADPLEGNPIVASGGVGRWDGMHTGFSHFEDFDSLMHGADSPFKDCEIDRIWDENGHLFIDAHHHDGSVHVELLQLTDKGGEALEAMEDAWADEPFTAGGRSYSGSDESLSDFWHDLLNDPGLSSPPRYLETAFGRQPLEWDMDPRVIDFMNRMNEEYARLYEAGVTGITSPDMYDRYDGFQEGNLGFVRALVKARGLDPISSDREITALLNTYDAMFSTPEPEASRAASTELDPLDPADPLNAAPAVDPGMAR
ncbi:hypothetical protein BISA_2207 [Bifidobacterium saguini DSM 23967]|uniref:Uncharacterized protein n=3 Tax=Bifidobacterium saguini TaxID=762210 RepID=A0A087D5N5_9BIFI|nr:hypothetical protein BISA_2207 [Bifidobacterium saguini DSM 23967]QTB92100.1 hypothetical protein BSD967_10745 [Bifidobacterium saguini]